MITPDPQTLLLSVALVLALWLLLRVRGREERDRRPKRANPLTPDELGRTVFQIARGADLDAFRALFLTGAEAAEMLGEDAPRYLEQRTLAAMEESLVNIAARIPEGSVFGGAIVPPSGEAILYAKDADGGKAEVPMGTAIKVRHVWRLHGLVRS